MLTNVQRKGIRYTPLLSFALSLMVGLIIILFSIQLYLDSAGIMKENKDAFTGESAVVSKKVSIFKTLNKKGLYFDQDEINNIVTQPFVEQVGTFRNATFKIMAFTTGSQELPPFYTDLFFESIPNSFLDIKPEKWHWNEQDDFLPVIIPESYLNLYNFGFAESQGLPVFSEGTISNVVFQIRIGEGNNTREFKSSIVGFSEKINSILVPDDFLVWANRHYGTSNEGTVSRLLVQFADATDESVIAYFNNKNYQIDQGKLKQNKLVFAFKSILGISVFMGIVILSLSIALMIFGILLIVQKNKVQIINLGILGYSKLEIARFYLKTVSVLIVVVSAIGAVIADLVIRNTYISSLEHYFRMEDTPNAIYLVAVGFTVLLLFAYNVIVYKRIGNILH